MKKGYWIGVLIIVAAVAWMWTATRPLSVKQKRVTEKTKTVLRSTDRAWLPLPEPALLPVKKKPNFPSFVPLAVTFKVGDKVGNDSPWLKPVSERLLTLLSAHPDQVINRQLSTWIKQGEVQVEFVEYEGNSGASLSLGKVSNENDSNGSPRFKYVPVLSIDVSRLADLGDLDKVALMQLVLLHENRHLLQISEQKDETLVRNLFIRDGSHHLSPKECELQWNLEREAYDEECWTASDWGCAGLQWYCLRVSDQAAFDQALFRILFDGKQGLEEPQCRQVWARLAGHPYPEAFAIDAQLRR